MDLSIQKLNKAFNRRIVFRDLTFDIKAGSRFAITGSNGSGKSTLLKILSGGTLPTSGQITYTHDGKQVPDEQVYQHVHFVAPYNTVIEELSLPELFALHQRLGLLKAYRAYRDWVSHLDYPFQQDQQIKMYSSGMKQRIKLGIALLDDRPLIFLDEPGSNLDEHGKHWLRELIINLDKEKTLLIATNDPVETSYCHDHIHMSGVEGSHSGR